MSPEQARGEKLDERSDLFSLGGVLYEMATGRQAFPGDSAAMILDAIVNRIPAPALGMNAVLPARLEEIINKCLEKDRRLRYQSASDLHADLRRLKRDVESGRTAATSSGGTAGAIAPRLRKSVAVGTLVAPSPPHGSVRADFPHTALIVDVWRQSVHSDTGAEFVARQATGWPGLQSAPRSRAAAALDGVPLAARVAGPRPETPAAVGYYPVSHGS
jgi:serine/threonine protein kinase